MTEFREDAHAAATVDITGRQWHTPDVLFSAALDSFTVPAAGALIGTVVHAARVDTHTRSPSSLLGTPRAQLWGQPTARGAYRLNNSYLEFGLANLADVPPARALLGTPASFHRNTHPTDIDMRDGTPRTDWLDNALTLLHTMNAGTHTR